MSILTIAQNVALETGFVSPTTLVSNADEFATQTLALIKKEVRDLSNGVIPGLGSSGSFNWQKLVKRGTFNYVNGQEAYTLPTDFKDFVPDTLWNYTSRVPVIAPTTPEGFEINKNYLITSAIYKQVYVYGNQLHITPTPASTDTINYEYTTNNLYWAADGTTGKSAITLDTDLTVVDEWLVELGVKMRFLIAKGLIPSIQFQASYEYQNYNQAAQRAMLKDGFGRPPLAMRIGGAAYWMAAYTQNSDFPAS